MRIKSLTASSVIIIALTGCENLPGTREEQAAAIGGAAGAAVGAAATENLWGAILGGLAGAAGGHLIGANTDWFERDPQVRQDQAQAAIQQAQTDPATVADVATSTSADLNGNGFVTSDELLAMEEAGLTDEEIIRRLEATDQVFDLSQEQREEFLAAGLSPIVISEMENINRLEREAIMSNPSIVSSPA